MRPAPETKVIGHAVPWICRRFECQPSEAEGLAHSFGGIGDIPLKEVCPHIFNRKTMERPLVMAIQVKFLWTQIFNYAYYQ